MTEPTQRFYEISRTSGTGGADLDVYELMHVTARLRDLMQAEIEHLKTMRIKEMAALQEEKMQLTQLLEAYQRMVDARPELLHGINEEVREELRLLSDEFAAVVSENMKRTAVARAVNQRVVQAIIEVISDQQSPGTYTKNGTAAVPPGGMAVPFNLNHKA